MESYEQPQSLVPSQGEGANVTGEVMTEERECDREQRVSESVEKKELHCNRRKQRDRDRR